VLVLALTGAAEGQITVNPTGVGLRHSGATTAFLTFRGLEADQQPMEGLWCGEINEDNSCVPGTIFGRLPSRSNLSRLSSGGTNFTDIMTVPPSVTRRAYQDAQRGNDATFFYVRRFMDTSDGSSEFVAVICRMAGGGARSPLSLTDVRLAFEVDRPVLATGYGAPPPPFGATIEYTGAGRLKGRWEVVLPGDIQPSERDLLTEATLPVEERASQRRYTQIGRFDVFLPPTGRFHLEGPKPENLPAGSGGLHLILLRIEATEDVNSRSDTGTGVLQAAGVAGFPIPVLRYYVGAESVAVRLATLSREGLQLIAPMAGEQLGVRDPLNFSWMGAKDAFFHRLEVKGAEGPILTALVDPGVSSYTAPPWIRSHRGEPLRWRVQAVGADGETTGQTPWNEFSFVPEGTDSDPATTSSR
jgi:hypothetical protein